MRHTSILIALTAAAAITGCRQHPLTDYRPLDQAGMWSDDVEQLKTLNVSDSEVSQLVRLKQAGIGDETCVSLVNLAHQHKHVFSSADSVNSLAGAGFTEQQILDIAKTDHLDIVSGDLVTLRLIGLSDSTVQFLMQRKLSGQSTLSSGEISRLKNTGLSESWIVGQIKSGMTDPQADKVIALREAQEAHANTGFVRVRGRRPR
ncbi:MAG TPA: hypothetical protein VJP87_10275 [Candidatus Acidoferrales bacterium]|nr:hypothetical protein [Candidatus Acidoferrales bacterium]